MYDNGKGTPQDYKQALKWYRIAAEQGHAKAQYSLAIMYDNGKGTPQDYKQALKWYTKAAEQGLAQAQYSLAIMYDNGEGTPQDYVRAHMWYNLSAARGVADAAKYRDLLSQKMTSEDISKAQALAQECIKKKYKGC